VVIIQVGGLVHSGHNSGWRVGSGNNLGDKELKGKKGQEVGGGCSCKGGGGVGW
jgi:hypothetical protein